MKKISILTLGCPKNIVDSEKVMSSFVNVYDFTENVNDADIILLNTCGFLQDSIDEAFEYIEKLGELKAKKPFLILIVFGCMVSRLINEGFDLQSRFNFVNNFVPLVNEHNISEILLNIEADNYPFLRNKQITRRINITSQHYSYLKISDGCNRHCTFCTIPSIKGHYISVPKNILINEAIELVKSGIKEIILIGQETTNYGIDIGTSLYDLLDDLSNIEGLAWIRVMYFHPNSFDLKILDLMNKRKNICKYIDIPLQHIDNNVLKLMGRQTSTEKIIDLINKIRVKVPNMHIRSTFITGFPSENSSNHKKLLNFLKEMKLERVGVFKYSQEPNTPAYNIAKQVSANIKQKRFDELMSLQQHISLEHNQNLIGKKVKVLIEEDYDDKYFIGRSEFDAPDIDNRVFIEKKNNKIENKTEDNNKKIGSISDFIVFDAREYDIYVR
jgi:ribosomal protein S12 methylthiotransferase